MSITSELYTLEQIVDQPGEAWSFNVPIYQRLYVWGEDQINTLLTDIAHAYDRNEEQFFLGGTLLVEKTAQQDRADGLRRFDLIDGQQRFTTLWLLSTVAVWREVMGAFRFVRLKQGSQPRLRFSIREQVNVYLNSLMHDTDAVVGEALDTQSMRHAQQLMMSFASTYVRASGGAVDEVYLRGLADFVYRKVKLVLTHVPEGMDLNKLFEVINNRGVQLQHHEILKARLLQDIPAADRARYAALWSACADMSGFIERNLCAETHLEANQLGALYAAGQLVDTSAIHSALSYRVQSPLDDSSEAQLTLESIFASEEQSLDHTSDSSSDEGEEPWARSIIGFPLFLQHALRIWLHENSKADLKRLLDRQLLALFDEAFFAGVEVSAREANARSFIDLLWRLRVLWDEYVIKWVDQGDEEVHQVCLTSISVSDSKCYINRSRESTAHQGLSLLQGMLYHSQEITTHYWLTPFLYFIHKQSLGVRSEGKECERFFNFLCHLDNQLLGDSNDESLVVRTYWFMEEPWRIAGHLVFDALLQENHGVAFPHYWFYKQDFVLWCTQRNEWPLWSNFRFTAKNSVEHISPQRPQNTDTNKVSEHWLNRFGNLALVSRSINSEYSNLPFNEKRQRYFNKRNHESRPDSLKMDLIYANTTWGDTQARRHQEAMLTAVREHYVRSFSEQPERP
ncbi:DUF262 domain-containing protein [Pseudomonas sp. FSL W5-0299]|uniref:DUF262 domain-containing protein n=1 Tax=Pseudomonas sp. FSL W5-0299 TaxID=1917484 RepID=UPI00098B822A|nr:DUF262 domain-containing protein [Pseudomonas sp. FSL W5-0299]